MKRFLVFVGLEHEPSGGWGDFVGHFDDPAEATAACERARRIMWGFTCRESTWGQVVDTQDPEHPDGIEILCV